MDQRQWQTPARNGPQAEPEILPPGAMPAETVYGERDPYGYVEPMPVPPPRRRSGWQLAPATYILTGINIAVYLLMVLRGVSPTAPSSEQLIRHWGANVGVLVLANHEWWRLATSTFVHAGIVHLALNMWCLYNLGLL